MLRQSQRLSERGYGWFQHAPTNLLIGAILHTRRGLKWGVPAMLFLGGGYLYAIAICVTIIDRGGPGPLYLLVLLFGWNACKFLWVGPVSLVSLIRVRAQEHAAQRDVRVGENERDQQGTTTMQSMTRSETS